MTYRGHVKNGLILLDEPAALPEGARVDVAVAEVGDNSSGTWGMPRRSSQIKKTPGVSGGAACIGDSRIAVWTLVHLKKLGRSETELLGDFPGLTPADLDTVWDYYREHPGEIDQAISDQDRED